MSGPYRPGFPGNAGTPLSPASQANQPVSFKTDINRKKTKKWVAAKSYSYDGDDWGDDDDEEDEEDELEEEPPIPNSSRFAPAAQQPAPNPVAPVNPAVEASSTQAPAFVRPADIYRRMQEEKERAPHEFARSNTAPAEGAATSSAPTPAVHQDTSQTVPPQQLVGDDARSPSPLVIPEVKRLSGFGQDFFGSDSQPEQTAQPTQGPEAQGAVQGSSLHHNPSLGFTSVVHQAFDVDETPNSSTGSFSRSNSDGTSVISPIISPWKSETDKTPTIAEDPTAEASAQEPPASFKPGHRRDLSVPSPGNGPDRTPMLANAEEGQPVEVVRSSSQDSYSSSEWDRPESPDAREQTGSGEATPRPLSAVQQSFDHLNLGPTSVESPGKPSSEENQQRVPSPLQIPDEQPQHIPQIAPPLSVDESPVTEASPQDMESDRLRKEIMRSFSSDHTPGIVPTVQSQDTEPEESEVKSRPQHESTYLPSEYDSYWGEQGIPPTSPLQVRSATSPSEPATLVINPQSTGNVPSTEPVPSSAPSKPRQKLKKKFSWEASDDSEEDVLEEAPVSAPPTQPIQPPPIPVVAPETMDNIPLPLPSQSSTEINPEAFGNPDIQPSLPEYPTGEKEVLAQLEQQAEQPQSNLEYVAPIQEPEPSPFSQIDSSVIPPQTQPAPAPVNEASLPTFRKIMEISSPSEKIQVFNDTREQFAHIDSGLSDWIRRSSESLPEHADLIQANGRLPGGAPTSGLPPRAKFPKLSSLGNLSLPSTSSHGTDGSSSGFTPGHNRRGSGSPMTGVINRSNVESKGKDFLHSAGALGGKAGGKAAGAARGLFAKGKSKLRGADKGMSSIFRAQRRQSWAVSTTSSDAQSSSDLEFDQRQEEGPVNFSVSSRYSLQPVPRIPSLRLGDGKSFRESFDGDEAFSMHARSFSADFGGRMRSLTEGETIAFKPERASSLRRTMMSLDSDADESSRAGDSSGVGDSLSIATTSHDGNNLKSVEEIDTPVVASGSHGTEGKPKDSWVEDNESPHAAADVMDKDGSTSTNNLGHFFQTNMTSQDRKIPPSAGSEEVSPTLKHEPSQSNRQVSRLSQDNNALDAASPQLTIKPAMQQTTPDTVNSPGESVRSPVSPALPQDGKLSIPEPANRRDSIISQISEISQDEMDRIREKFDEDGIYAGLRDPSPTRSQVSDLTEDEDDVDGAIREKLDEAGFHSDPEKDAYGNFPRPPTASSNKQPIRVVRMTKFSIDKKTAQATEEETKRYSRFSFEGEGNTLAEAAEEMLVNGHARRSGQTDHPSQGDRLEGSHVPVTLGEDASDEAPPPFPDNEAQYGEDRKEQHPQGQTPAYDDHVSNSHSRQYSQAEGAKSPPGYRPIQSPPPSHLDTLWKTGRLQDLRTNRDSIASSSVSSMSNPNINQNAPRMTVSPEPPVTGAPPHTQQRLSHNGKPSKPQNLPRIDDVTASDKPGWSRWANHGRPQQAQQHSSNGSGLSPPLPSGSSSARRDGDSLHSGDSMIAQAAASRQDLRTTPSPLMNSSETASEHSNHGRMSTQLLSKVKFMGKRSKGAPAPASVPPADVVEAKAVEKRKEKKVDGKKGALSRFGGIFNRSGPNQRPEETTQPGRNSLTNDNAWGHGGYGSYPPATNNPQAYMPTTASSRHTSMPAQNKALPPPPAGYYAPASKPVYEPPVNYAHQSYPQHGNAYMDGYQHAPAPAQYAPSSGQYGYHSSPSSQSPPFQSQQQLRQPQQQPEPAHYAPSKEQYAYQSSTPFLPQQQLRPQPQPAPYAPSNEYYAHHSSTPLQPQPQLDQYVPSREQYPYHSPQPQPQHQLSTSSRSYNNISPTLNSSNSNSRASNASPELEQSRSRARDLRMRSRSPRPTQMRAVGSRSENVNYADPAYNLGKFNAVTETPRIGDQSLPFPITLPDDLANGQLSPRSSIQPESSIFYNRNRSSAEGQNPGLGLNQETQMSIASAIAGAGPATTPATNTTAQAANNRGMTSEYETRPVIAKNTIPIELPVPNDHDEDEIVMSSTAYPGQEWQPAGFEQWMPY
ncbi:hypothetical protein TCE0_038r12639 [Talaromyces pinophilus]|uniref:Uncharacterized protein n=1 Tax=Talaromyces pinophilus TaxID=128442 RepID=A0A0B8MY44_TALPI|nr:hypothetical protein TCE0_038r12639 [Talaromyces pinophilus]